MPLTLQFIKLLLRSSFLTNDWFRFLWVEFQLKAIYAQVSDLGIEETLKDMPKDINATYDRILDMIDKRPPVQRELARKALLFIAYAREPVSIDTLAVAIASKDHTQTLDMLRSSISTEKTILYSCGNLLSIDKTNPEIRRVCFVHFSVHEYLTSQQSHALSLEKTIAHREIARMCMTFLLILYSHIQDYCTGSEGDFIHHYILPALPFHLLDGNFESLPSNDEMINLTLLFFERYPLMLTHHRYSSPYHGIFYTFSPSVLALIFNLPGTYQCYNPHILYGEHFDQTVISRIYGKTTRVGSIRSRVVSDDRLAMHYAAGQLDSVPACQRLCTHGYPIEYSYDCSGAPLKAFDSDEGVGLGPGDWDLTPLYLVKSEGIAKFLLDRGASANPQGLNYKLPNLLAHIAREGNVKVIQVLLEHGAEHEVNALRESLCSLTMQGKVEAMKILLDIGVDINTLHDGPLRTAALSGRVEVIQLFVDKGLDFAQADCYRDALAIAANRGHVETLRLLLDKGANVPTQDRNLRNALQHGAMTGNVEIILLLLDKGADINAQGGKYGNALQAAACSRQFETMQLLLDQGADVHSQGGLFGNALQAAAFQGNVEAMRLLQEKGADVNAQGGVCGNALQAAANAQNSSAEAVQLLLNQGADIHIQGGCFGNALQAAASGGNTATIQLLLDNGVDINAQGGVYGNALQAAATSKNCSAEVVRLLLDQGADAHAQGGAFGNTLQAAALEGNVEAMRLLLEKGVDVNAQGGKYGNALQAAATHFKSGVEAVQLLLDQGADVHVQGGHFGNALQAAASSGNTATIRLLLDNGLDINAQGGEYGTALQAAALSRRSDAVKLLLGRGADVDAQGGVYGTALQAALSVSRDFRLALGVAEVLLDHGADVRAYVPGSKYGDPLNTIKKLWVKNRSYLIRLVALLESKGWTEDKLGTRAWDELVRCMQLADTAK